MIEIVPNWHPIWVHFPIALLSIAALLFVLGSVRPEHPLAATATTVARWNLALGMLFLLPTLVTGYLAYNSVAHDSAGHEAMHRHLYAAWITVALFVGAGFVAWRERWRTSGAGLLLLVLILPAAGMLSVTGYLGAENVYRHGIGVERLPDPDDHHHGHGHAEGHDNDSRAGDHDHGEQGGHEAHNAHNDSSDRHSEKHGTGHDHHGHEKESQHHHQHDEGEARESDEKAPDTESPVDDEHNGHQHGALQSLPEVVVWQSPTCGCCDDWVEHLRDDGFPVTTHLRNDLVHIKYRLGITEHLASCHTAEVDGYLIEGHVPAADIRRLLSERPPARGLAVPGMPIGSPGMEMGDRRDSYDVLLFGADGQQEIFASYP